VSDAQNFEGLRFLETSVTLHSSYLYFAHRIQIGFIMTLIDFQLDAQNSYLFIYNTFIEILYMLRALPCSSSGGPRRSFLTGAQDSHLQRGTIPEAAHIQLRRGPPEDEQGNARNM
jgi:hypothetical protein